MTKMYRVTQGGDVEERAASDRMPLGFHGDKDAVEKMAAVVAENPAYWDEYLAALHEGGLEAVYGGGEAKHEPKRGRGRKGGDD